MPTCTRCGTPEARGLRRRMAEVAELALDRVSLYFGA